MLGIGVYILAWLIVIHFLGHALAHHANSAAAKGLAPLL